MIKTYRIFLYRSIYVQNDELIRARLGDFGHFLICLKNLGKDIRWSRKCLPRAKRGRNEFVASIAHRCVK